MAGYSSNSGIDWEEERNLALKGYTFDDTENSPLAQALLYGDGDPLEEERDRKLPSTVRKTSDKDLLRLQDEPVASAETVQRIRRDPISKARSRLLPGTPASAKHLQSLSKPVFMQNTQKTENKSKAGRAETTKPTKEETSSSRQVRKDLSKLKPYDDPPELQNFYWQDTMQYAEAVAKHGRSHADNMFPPKPPSNLKQKETDEIVTRASVWKTAAVKPQTDYRCRDPPGHSMAFTADGVSRTFGSSRLDTGSKFLESAEPQPSKHLERRGLNRCKSDQVDKQHVSKVKNDGIRPEQSKLMTNQPEEEVVTRPSAWKSLAVKPQTDYRCRDYAASKSGPKESLDAKTLDAQVVKSPVEAEDPWGLAANEVVNVSIQLPNGLKMRQEFRSNDSLTLLGEFIRKQKQVPAQFRVLSHPLMMGGTPKIYECFPTREHPVVQTFSQARMWKTLVIVEPLK